MFNWLKNKNIISDKVIDTSVLIDGRILDILQTGFLEGKLIIPKFVLLELQNVSDSNDLIKRRRGQRGLTVLEKIQSLTPIEIHEKESQESLLVKEVDTKLVILCKETNAKLLTVDFNLNKVAKIQGVSVLNINELNLALRVPFAIGEPLNVKIIKRGEQKGQGIGFLDDGTMIVVDNADECVGERIRAYVRGINQKESTRIIFCKLYTETKE